jgi:plastocyanin
MTMRFLVGTAAALALAVVMWSCGGNSTPTQPSSGGGGGSGTVTITIVGMLGAQSFSPNPANVSQGSTVVWKNNDTITHRIVFNDGSVDTGDIAPGASSQPIQVNSNGANYHCAIHPTMVGSINSSTGAPPPCQGAYC